MAIRCHDQSPMLVIPTGVVEKHGLGILEAVNPPPPRRRVTSQVAVAA